MYEYLKNLPDVATRYQFEKTIPNSKLCYGFSGDEWGYTGTFDRDNGGGFLTDHFPEATKAIWQFDGIFASSRHIPGVRFPGLIHPGLIGELPLSLHQSCINPHKCVCVCVEVGVFAMPGPLSYLYGG